MKFRPLELICECGFPAQGFHEVGFTSEYEMVIHWTCTACRREAYLVKSLADCCKQCPDQEEAASRAVPFDARAEDAKFLQSLGIRP